MARRLAREDSSDMTLVEAWRDAARAIAGGAGIIFAVAILLWVLMNRESGASTSTAAAAQATLNLGLYVEGLFFLGCDAALVIAVYVVSRIDG